MIHKDVTFAYHLRRREIALDYLAYWLSGGECGIARAYQWGRTIAALYLAQLPHDHYPPPRDKAPLLLP